MKKWLKNTYNRLFLIVILLLSLPAIQMYTDVVDIKKLKGVYIKQALPDLSVENWLSSNYQLEVSKYLDQNFGFRPEFIRLYNQIDYSLFDIPHSYGVVFGKESQLYEKWYINSYYGNDFVGDKVIDSTIHHLERINRTLIDSLGTKMMIVLAPGKASYYPEYIPDHLKSEKVNPSNYDAYKSKLQNSSIPCVDFNDWFLKIKDTIPYPLFPRTGTHWSQYGATLAADSLMRYMEGLLDMDLANLSFNKVTVTKKPRVPDNDLEANMNLYFPIEDDDYFYPRVKYEKGKNKDKPYVIVVSDSYFWNLFNISGFVGKFNKLKYWYYNNSVYPDSYKGRTTVADLNLYDQLSKADLVILMSSTSPLGGFPWKFHEKASKVLNASEHEKKVLAVISRMRNSEKWYSAIKKKAKARNVSIDRMMRADAEYLIGKKKED